MGEWEGVDPLGLGLGELGEQVQLILEPVDRLRLLLIKVRALEEGSGVTGDGERR